MLKISLKLDKKSAKYPIFIDKGTLLKLGKSLDLSKYSKVVVLSDTNVSAIWLNKFSLQLKKIYKPKSIVSIVLPPGEKAKNLDSIASIWTQLLEHGADKKSCLICLGGGVIGDLGGFAAATFLRGMDVIQFPTSLLAQVDSSVGGKTGFDFFGVKNNIGLIKQPASVVIDTQFLQSLPRREFISGFAEILKYGLVHDLEFWNFLSLHKLDDFLYNQDFLVKAVYQSCLIKANIVSKDEDESLGLRKILNFGHTFGHALEAYSQRTIKPLLHGEAVAIGMMTACKISELKGFLTSDQVETIKKVLVNYCLPVTWSKTKQPELLQTEFLELVYKFILQDKKNASSQVNWILLKDIASPKIDQSVDKETLLEAIKNIIL